MSLAIPATAQTALAAQTASEAKPAAAASKAAPSQPSSKGAAPADTVKISTAAQTALQESQETQAQTVREASHGDQQAARLLSKEAAAKKL